jgi:hypothetical protein
MVRRRGSRAQRMAAIAARDVAHDLSDRELGEISVVQYTINCFSIQLAQMRNGGVVRPPCCRCGFATGDLCETCFHEEVFLPSWRGYAVTLPIVSRYTPLCFVCNGKFGRCQFHWPSLQRHLVSFWSPEFPDNYAWRMACRNGRGL